MRDLTRGPLVEHIVAMALPIAIGMFVQTMHYLVDLYFVSRLGGVALAGVSAAGIVMFLVLALTQTLSVGTVALVSHAVGQEDRDRANLIFNQAVALAGMLAALVFAAGYLLPYKAAVGELGPAGLVLPMLLAAATTLSELAPSGKLVPDPLERGVHDAVARAVRQAALG